MEETEENLSHDRIWYVKKQGKVFGPFGSGKLRHFILEGKVELSDQVGKDKRTWQSVGSTPEVVPLQMRDPDALDDLDNTPDSLEPGRKGSLWLPVMLVLLLLGGGIWISLQSANEQKLAAPDCFAAPAAAVNWSNCIKKGLVAEGADLKQSKANNAVLAKSRLSGANLTQADLRYIDLSDSDLSYVNFEGAELKGADLHHSDLSYAVLKNADLRYADFTNATLGGADLSGARLGGAVWINGKTCASASVGECQY